MKLIEVIAGCNTPAETVEKIKEISVAIGKQPVQVNEAAGFVVNRILIPMINEAAFIKMEGVSDIAGIDTAMKLGANHPMVPWSWATSSAWISAWPSWMCCTRRPATASTVPAR